MAGDRTDGLRKLADAAQAIGLDPHWVLCKPAGPNPKAPQARAWQKTTPGLDAVLPHPGLVGVIPASLGCAVVDIDRGAEAAAEAITARLGKPLATVSTMGGGLHLWYRCDSRPGNARWEIPEGSGDIRGARGFVVLWDPAEIAAGLARYHETDPVAMKLPKPAARVGQGLKSPDGGVDDPYIASAVAGEIGKLAAAAPGARNETLNTAAFNLGQLAGSGRHADLVRGRLAAAARDLGLPDIEITATLNSGWDAGRKKPRERPATPARGRPGLKIADAKTVDPTIAPDRHAPGLAFAFEALGVDFRLDIRSGRTEFRRSPGYWEPLTDTAAASMRQEIAAGFSYIRSDGAKAPLRFGRDTWRESLLAILHGRRVDPFREWLETLPPVEGDMGMLDAWLPELFGVQDPTPLHAWASRYIFLAPVQRTMDPGCQLDEVPVLLGEQGIGKSSVLRNTLPEDPPGWQDRLYSGRLKLDDTPQRQVEALLGRVLIELSELTGIRDRRRIEDIKTFITLRDDGDIRLAYAENPEPRPRRCAFVGTSNPNPSGVLPNDPTGNRRWVVVELNRPEGPVEAFMATHRKQLWTEALERYRAGERANLPRDLAELAARAAEAARWRDPLEDDLDEALANRAYDGLLTFSELARLMGNDDLVKSPRDKRRLGEALIARGWHRDRGHSGRGYMPPGSLLLPEA